MLDNFGGQLAVLSPVQPPLPCRYRLHGYYNGVVDLQLTLANSFYILCKIVIIYSIIARRRPHVSKNTI